MHTDSHSPQQVKERLWGRNSFTLIMVILFFATLATLGSTLLTSLTNPEESSGLLSVVSLSSSDRNEETASVQNDTVELSLLETGIINDNGEFITASTLTKDNTVGIRFAITNGGKTDLERWNIVATLPTNPERTLSSSVQTPLKAGTTRVFLLTFDRVATGESQVVIAIGTLDSKESVLGTLTLPLRLR